MVDSTLKITVDQNVLNSIQDIKPQTQLELEFTVYLVKIPNFKLPKSSFMI